MANEDTFVANFGGTKTSGEWPQKQIRTERKFTMPKQELTGLLNDNYELLGWRYKDSGLVYTPGQEVDLSSEPEYEFNFTTVWDTTKKILCAQRGVIQGEAAEYKQIKYTTSHGMAAEASLSWLNKTLKEAKTACYYQIIHPRCNTESERIKYDATFEGGDSFEMSVHPRFENDIVEIDLNGCILNSNNQDKSGHTWGWVFGGDKGAKIIFKSSAPIKGQMIGSRQGCIWHNTIDNIEFHNIEITQNRAETGTLIIIHNADGYTHDVDTTIKFIDTDIHDNDLYSSIYYEWKHSLICVGRGKMVVEYISGNVYNEGGWHTTDGNSIYRAEGTFVSFVGQNGHGYSRLSLGTWLHPEIEGPHIYNLGVKNTSLFHMPYHGAIWANHQAWTRIDIWNADIENCAASVTGGAIYLGCNNTLLLYSGCKIHGCRNYSDHGGQSNLAGGAITLNGDDWQSGGAGAYWLNKPGQVLAIYGGEYYENIIDSSPSANGNGAFLGIHKEPTWGYQTYYRIYGGKFYKNYSKRDGGVFGTNWANEVATAGSLFFLGTKEVIEPPPGEDGARSGPIEIYENKTDGSGSVFAFYCDHQWVHLMGYADIHHNESHENGIFGYALPINNIHIDIGNPDITNEVDFPRIHDNLNHGGEGVIRTHRPNWESNGAFLRLQGNVQIYSNKADDNKPANVHFSLHKVTTSNTISIICDLGKKAYIEYDFLLSKQYIEEQFLYQGDNWAMCNYAENSIGGCTIWPGDEYRFKCTGVYDETFKKYTDDCQTMVTRINTTGGEAWGYEVWVRLGANVNENSIFLGSEKRKSNEPYQISKKAFMNSNVDAIYIHDPKSKYPEAFKDVPWGASKANVMFATPTTEAKISGKKGNQNAYGTPRNGDSIAILYGDGIMEFSYDLPDPLQEGRGIKGIWGGARYRNTEIYKKYQSVWWWSNEWFLCGNTTIWDYLSSRQANPYFCRQPNIFSNGVLKKVIWKDPVPVLNYTWFTTTGGGGITSNFKSLTEIQGTPGAFRISSLNRAFSGWCDAKDYNLKTVDLNFNSTKNLYSIYYMFEGQRKLEEVKGIGQWDTSNLRWCSGAFRDCKALKRIDLSGWVLTDQNGNLNHLGKSFINHDVDIPYQYNVPIFGDGDYKCDALEEIRLPAAVENAWPSGYDTPDKWGAPNATVYYVN